MSDELTSTQPSESIAPVGAASLRLILSTFPGEAIARQTAHTLVKENLVACVNVIPGVTSIYRWEGKMETEPEVLAIFKTTVPAAVVMARLKQLHPYEVPEMVAVDAAEVSAAYLEWVRQACGGK